LRSWREREPWDMTEVQDCLRAAILRDLAKVVMALATMLKEQERAQQRAERRLRDADTVPPP
jgi:hypothetical protein